MQPFFTLIRRELAGHFFSWTGYVVVAAVVFLIGFCFHLLIGDLMARPTDQPLTEVFYQTVWVILWVATPVITMRTFALERSTGTFETLMTAPVSDTQVVLAKFTASMLFYCLTWLPLIGCLEIISYYSNQSAVLEPGIVFSTYLGVLLLGSVYIALGCFTSSLTRNQIIAAILSLVGGISLFLLNRMAAGFASAVGWKAQLFSYLNLVEHMQDFSRGVIDTRPLIFSATTTFFLLFLTLRAIQSRRWKP